MPLGLSATRSIIWCEFESFLLPGLFHHLFYLTFERCYRNYFKSLLFLTILSIPNEYNGVKLKVPDKRGPKSNTLPEMFLLGSETIRDELSSNVLGVFHGTRKVSSTSRFTFTYVGHINISVIGNPVRLCIENHYQKRQLKSESKIKFIKKISLPCLLLMNNEQVVINLEG